MEDDNNLNDTIENDLKNENRSHIPGKGRLRRKAKTKAKELAKKGRKKAAKALFKPVGYSVFATFAGFIIIVFMLLGIVTFIATMPGLVQQNILNKVTQVLGEVTSYFIDDDVKMLNDLASVDENSEGYKARINVLMYLDDMGLDPVGFGFAPFYERDKDENGNKLNTARYNNSVLPQNVPEIEGFIDSLHYNESLREAVKKEDLIFKYLVSNERTYMLHNIDEIGSDRVGVLSHMLGYDTDLKGMIEFKIDGIDDSSTRVDRKTKQLIIKSLNAVGVLNWQNQEAKYNIDSWAGRYGMPLEFLLALHVGTMSSDITTEMLNSKYLGTKVKVNAQKADYEVVYDIEYEGKNLGIKRGKQNDYYGIYDLGQDIIKRNDNGTFELTLSKNEIQELKNNGTITLNSLWYWVNNLATWNISETRNPNEFQGLAESAKNALISGDSLYLTQYLYVETGNLNSNTINETAYLGEVKESTRYPGTWYSDLDDRVKGEKSGFKEIIGDQNGEWVSFIYESATDTNSESELIIPRHSQMDNNLKNPGKFDLYEETEQGYIRPTVILHGLPYYIDNVNDIRNYKYIRKGIEAMLSQIDAYLYELDNSSQLLQTEGIEFKRHSITPWEMEFTQDSLNDNNAVYFLLTDEWRDFCNSLENGGKSDDEIKQELQKLIDDINHYYDIVNNKEEHVKEIYSDMLNKLDLPEIDIETLNQIHDALESQTDEYEFVLPRIDYVIKHWYKDVVFENGNVSVYKEINDLQYNVTLDNDLDGKLTLTANLYYQGSGNKPVQQKSQPYVVKGDVVTLDGEIVTNGPAANLPKTEIEGYTLGDGYRVTKKLFTQGQYYVFDGSKETSQSIYYAREMEKMKAGQWAQILVESGRIKAFLTNNISEANLAEREYTVKSTPYCDIYKVVTNSPTITRYYINAKQDLNYISVGSIDSDIFSKSNESVKKINGILEEMGVVTTRKPVSFDNTTTNGDVSTLTAFSILENMHTEAAEYIYRDFKEFLIELGYYTKAEFEYLDTKVLKWFIPDYKPKDSVQWSQNDETDALKYGAIIYQQKTGEDDNTTKEGFVSGSDIIAPGAATILEVSEHKIKLEFNGIEQPEIGILDGYTMIITGEGVNITTEKKVGDKLDAEEVIGVTVTNEDQTAEIQVIMKNKMGGYVSDIQDYMGPEISGPQSGDSFSIVGTLLTKQEFTSSCMNYMSQNGIHNNAFSEENLKKFYDICKNKGVNPEFAFVTAVSESGLTAGEAVSTDNYWGLDTPNGQSVPRLANTMLDTLELYCDRIVGYQNPETSEYKKIMERYNERSQCTEGGGCDPNGFGTPDTLQGIQSIYSWLGTYHVHGGPGEGGYYYLDPDRTNGISVVYKTHGEFISRCKNVHPEGSPTTVWEQNQYTAWQVTKKINQARAIFGENAGKFMK